MQVEKSGLFISRLNLALIPITSATLQCSQATLRNVAKQL